MKIAVIKISFVRQKVVLQFTFFLDSEAGGSSVSAGCTSVNRHMAAGHSSFRPELEMCRRSDVLCPNSHRCDLGFGSSDWYELSLMPYLWLRIHRGITWLSEPGLPPFPGWLFFFFKDKTCFMWHNQGFNFGFFSHN